MLHQNAAIKIKMNKLKHKCKLNTGLLFGTPDTADLERISLMLCVGSKNLHLNGYALVTYELVLCRSPCVCRTAALILLFKNKTQILYRLIFLSF